MTLKNAFKKHYLIWHSSFRGWVLLVLLLAIGNNLIANNQQNQKDNSNTISTKELIQEGEAFLKEGSHLEQADSCFALALSQAKNNKNLNLEIEAWYCKSLVLYNLGDYTRSSKILDSLLTNSEKLAQPLHANILKLLGNDLVYLGEYARAYENQLHSYEYFYAQSDTLNMAMLHFSIGNNFFYQKQYQLALEEFNKSLELWEKKKHEKGIYWALGAIGSVYEHLGNLEKAIEFSEQSLKLAIQLENKEDIAWTLYIIGSISSTAKDLEKSILSLNKARKLAIEQDDIPLLGYVLEALTITHIRGENYVTALKTLDESFEIAERNNDRANIPGLYKLYSDIHFELKHYDAGREYIQKYVSLKDSLQNAELASSMGSLKQDFEVREIEKQKEIELLKKDTKIKSFRVLFWGAAFVIAALSFIFYLIIVRVKHKHVREKSDLLLANNQRILQQNEILKSSNRDLKQYAYIISHDLKEPLRNIGSFTNLLRRKMGDRMDDDAREYMNFITGGVKQMHNLLSDLLEYSKIRNKSKEATVIKTRVILEEVMASIHTRILSTHTSIKIGDLPSISMVQSHFFQVMLNLISNAIKFAGEDSPRIDIDCKTDEANYIFSVKDNGIGIDSEFQEKVFVVFQRLNNRAEYSGSGIGLATCKKIINEYGGKIWLESTPGMGSTFYFSVPKHRNDIPASDSEEIVNEQVSPQLN